ncbi:dihydrodipicolinate synthase family protein [Dysgonomonas sp. 520]|uniref:dihydrodipicolinate synthase family protein n=1 Tax=Dysgonomonas sp. 520 TaxID=2302931 RepID=UPI0013D3A883|nr:dihydrodipicolinate synthase family protein [Dysgonomonas sp. 520]NDW09692.1 dihydrodipicolinate synthase family protein [Dysgonomonas sp. 520]
MNTYKTPRGIIPPMITPLLDTDTLDEKGVENLVEHLIEGGVSGIFVLGTTGEAQHLSMKIKTELVVKTCACAKGRVPVLVGITDTSVYESIKLAKIAAEHGASAVVCAPPYYFALGQPELIEYYEFLANESPLPLYLYNMPSHTKTMIELGTVEVLAKHPNIVGLKDSSANGVYFCKLLNMFKDQPEFGLYVGPEEMMSSVALLGAHGGVSGGANVYPRIFVDLYNAAANKDVDKTIELQNKMICISNELFGIGKFGSSYIKGIKTALSLKGICSDHLAQPFNLFKNPEKEKVKAVVEHLDKFLK